MVFLLVSQAHSAAVPSQPATHGIHKSGEDDAISLAGLIATVLGVIVAAIGVFGWKCWSRRKVKKVVYYCFFQLVLTDLSQNQSVDLPLHSPPLSPGGMMYPRTRSVNHYHYYPTLLPQHLTAADEPDHATVPSMGAGLHCCHCEMTATTKSLAPHQH